jgi:hypothetical protein
MSDIVAILCTDIRNCGEFRVAKIPYGTRLYNAQDMMDSNVVRAFFNNSAVFSTIIQALDYVKLTYGLTLYVPGDGSIEIVRFTEPYPN